MLEDNGTEKQNTTTGKSNEDRPKRGLEDWEMLQNKEEPPLRIPYWSIILVVGLFIGAVLLSFPFMGVRSGFERPWFDWGLLVGVGYGVFALVVIYLFMRNRKKSAKESKANITDTRK